MVAIYVHLPYCAQICHYCDFAKTANFSPAHVASYFDALAVHGKHWLRLWNEGAPADAIDTLYFGGGTPSLFTEEYANIMQLFQSWLAVDAEITLEANPEHITASSVAAWRRLGFNRLSLGQQSFQTKGLKFLTRTHSGTSGRRALEVAMGAFDNVSIDLIYGWPSQTEQEWQSDLETVIAARVGHCSAYGLTYESSTTIGKRLARGLIEPQKEEAELGFFLQAHAQLTGAGMRHYEISNYARSGKQARHNSNYWTGGSYLALGSGAHGFLKGVGPFGLRFKYPKNDRVFAALPVGALPAAWSAVDEKSLARGGLEIDYRDEEGWLLERISCGLRTTGGVPCYELAAQLRKGFKLSGNLLRAVEEGLGSFSPLGVLTLSPQEWFREQSWCLEVLRSFS